MLTKFLCLRHEGDFTATIRRWSSAYDEDDMDIDTLTDLLEDWM
jgi:hypothetical protein